MTVSKGATVDVQFRLAVTGRHLAKTTLPLLSTIGDMSQAFQDAAQEAGEGDSASGMTSPCFILDGDLLSGGGSPLAERRGDVVLDVVLVQPLRHGCYESSLESVSSHTSQLKLTLSPDGSAELMDIQFDEDLQPTSLITRRGTVHFKAGDGAEFRLSFFEEEEMFIGAASTSQRIRASCACRIADDGKTTIAIADYKCSDEEDVMEPSLWLGRHLTLK